MLAIPLSKDSARVSRSLSREKLFRAEARDEARRERATLPRTHATGAIGISVLTSRTLLPVQLHVLVGAKLPGTPGLDGREVNPDLAGPSAEVNTPQPSSSLNVLTLPVTTR
jgi:hypothetical protein